MKERRIFLKGETYKHEDSEMEVMCTKTTCHISTPYFTGVVMKAGRFPVGEFRDNWDTSQFMSRKITE